MSKEHDVNGLGVRPSQVVSGALAAVTAAVLGSTMGVAGTVVGAGIASIITTMGTALYLRSLDRTKAGVRLVRERVRSGVTSQVIIEKVEEEEDDVQPPRTSRLRWGTIVAGSVLAFVLGMVAITGYEKLTGEPLSGGTGTTLGDVIRPQQHPQQKDDQQTPTPTTRTSTVTVTVPADPTTSVTPSAPSTSGSATSTTTTPPDTTTTTPPTSSTPPSGGGLPSQ